MFLHIHDGEWVKIQYINRDYLNKIRNHNQLIMKLKKFLITLTPVMMLLLIIIPAHSRTNPEPIVDLEKLETEEDFQNAYEVLKAHVKELKAAKRAATTKAEKQHVKQQIEATKNEIEAVKAKALSGGIYIGSGALLLIIILLILL